MMKEALSLARGQELLKQDQIDSSVHSAVQFLCESTGVPILSEGRGRDKQYFITE